jgi:bifunctional DNA-binding transcriptional regulator/antitoxin component of YhaV-PrlF toxin-antitoxin module
MKVTASGQVSVPAEVRRRWDTTRVKITDEGDRLVIEPEPENPFEGLLGSLRGELSATWDEMEAEERASERERHRRKWPQFPEGDPEEDRRGGPCWMRRPSWPCSMRNPAVPPSPRSWLPAARLRP